MGMLIPFKTSLKLFKLLSFIRTNSSFAKELFVNKDAT